MKALKTTLPIKELQKTIGGWKSRKITDSVIPKLLELHLGVTAYMNDEAVYPVENFYDLGLALKFKNARCLVEAIKQSCTFGIVPGENIYGMKAFYSYLWKEKEDAETFPEEYPEKFPQEDIYNINNNNNRSPEEALAAVKEFFHLINEAPLEKAQIFTPLINWFQLHENLTRSHACDNLVCLVNELLTPHFASQERFMKSNHIGRLCWLRNLLKSPHGQRLLKDAARAGREQREREAREKRGNQRSNHPLSQFEWTDEETGVRFYDDPAEGTVNIPDDAQPRPSGEAVWNVLSKQWNNTPRVP